MWLSCDVALQRWSHLPNSPLVAQPPFHEICLENMHLHFVFIAHIPWWFSGYCWKIRPVHSRKQKLSVICRPPLERTIQQKKKNAKFMCITMDWTWNQWAWTPTQTLHVLVGEIWYGLGTQSWHKKNILRLLRNSYLLRVCRFNSPGAHSSIMADVEETMCFMGVVLFLLKPSLAKQLERHNAFDTSQKHNVHKGGRYRRDATVWMALTAVVPWPFLPTFFRNFSSLSIVRSKCPKKKKPSQLHSQNETKSEDQ